MPAPIGLHFKRWLQEPTLHFTFPTWCHTLVRDVHSMDKPPLCRVLLFVPSLASLSTTAGVHVIQCIAPQHTNMCDQWSRTSRTLFPTSSLTSSAASLVRKPLWLQTTHTQESKRAIDANKRTTRTQQFRKRGNVATGSAGKKVGECGYRRCS
jgi:hypothetical protein